MRRIKRLKIGGHWVDVKYYPRREISGMMGEAWNCENIIRLCTDFPASQQECAVLHEIMHHCLNNLGHRWELDGSHKIHNETLVQALTHALYQVLRDNKIEFTGEIDE